MKNATGLLPAILLLAAGSLHAQLVVPSYERVQPFLFCGADPQLEPLTVPFDFINTGRSELLIDSAIAVGDTSDFHANGIPGSGEYYLNPVMWKYLNGRTVPGGVTLFNNFFFAPKTPGDKRLDITIYYHVEGAAATTRATIRFRSAPASSGLGLLAWRPDTVLYSDPVPYRVVTFDRAIYQDTLFLVDTVRVGDSLRAGTAGERRIDLVSCGATVVTEISAQHDAPHDEFTVYAPPMPVTVDGWDSTLVDFLYVPKAAPGRPVRTATVSFNTGDEQHVVLHLTIVVPGASDVRAEDERGEGDDVMLRSLPNPFAGATTLRLGLARPAQVRLTVVNALGEQAALLYDGALEAGDHQLRFDGTGLPAGVYFARLDAGGRMITRRLVLAR